MENKIKKMLIGFFAILVIFTILSRAAASAMVAKVQVETVKRGNLTYKVSGEGIVKADAQKYINLISGYKIGEVLIEEGQQVEKGAVLFTYDEDQLKEKESDLEDEKEKLQLQYQKIGLANVSADGSIEEEAAKLAVKNAEEDIKTARMELAKNKEEEYEQAVSEWEDVKASKNKAEREAKQAVSDAEYELSIIKEPETAAKEAIDNYRNVVLTGNETLILDEFNNIFNLYYDNKFEEHQQQVSDAVIALERANEDLENIKLKWENTPINDFDRYGKPDVRNTYFAQAEQKRMELSSQERIVQDAQKSLDELTENDEALTQAINDYRNDVTNNILNINNTFPILYNLLTEDKLADKAEIKVDEERLTRAQEDEEATKEEWDKKLETAAADKEKLLNILEAIEAGTYDDTADIQEETRALEEANLQLKRVEEANQLTTNNQQRQDEADGTERRIQEIDINKVQEELELLQDLIENGGEVLATVSGEISYNDLDQGITLTGQEKLILSTGGYELEMMADKEEMKYFSTGDELKINSSSGEGEVTAQIENIELLDQEEKVSFTALLPEGEYTIGSSLKFSLEKASQDFSMCISIQALCQDSQGTYVLVVKNMDSILGKVEEAFRVNVTVLSMDTKSAAVEAALTEEDNIIISSNKNSSEGDRVRIYEME